MNYRRHYYLTAANRKVHFLDGGISVCKTEPGSKGEVVPHVYHTLSSQVRGGSSEFSHRSRGMFRKVPTLELSIQPQGSFFITTASVLGFYPGLVFGR